MTYVHFVMVTSLGVGDHHSSLWMRGSLSPSAGTETADSSGSQISEVIIISGTLRHAPPQDSLSHCFEKRLTEGTSI